MCGRFALAKAPTGLEEAFDAPLPDLAPRYNIAPTQSAPVLLREPERGGDVVFQPLQWGLVPFWSRDARMGAKLINARSETAAEKPAFRAALRHRRCLIPASGFFEWKRDGAKILPHYFLSGKGEDIVFAGIWEDWERDGAFLRTFCILTTDANSDMRPIHNRMPVLLPPEEWSRWLDPNIQNPDELAPLMRPAPPDTLKFRRVGDYVNNPKNEGQECIREVPALPHARGKNLFGDE